MHKKILILFSVLVAFLATACNQRPNITFSEAVEVGNEKAVKYYLKHGGMVNQRNEKGVPLLMLALQTGNNRILELLLQAGALAQIEDKNGRTALCLAVQTRRPEIVSKLLKAGAEVNSPCTVAKDEFMTGSPSQILRELYRKDLVLTREILEDAFSTIRESKKQPVVNALQLAAYQGDEASAKLLLESGARVNVRSSQGMSALAVASAQGNVNVVKLLLAHGAKVDGRDENAWTPLMMSSMQGEEEVVQALLSAGADVNANDDLGRTALILASMFGHADVAKILLDAGADPRAMDERKLSAVGYADLLGYTEMIELFPEVQEELFAQEAQTLISSVMMAEQIYFLQHGIYTASLQNLDREFNGSVSRNTLSTGEYTIRVHVDMQGKTILLIATRNDGRYKGNGFSYSNSKGPMQVGTNDQFFGIIRKVLPKKD